MAPTKPGRTGFLTWLLSADPPTRLRTGMALTALALHLASVTIMLMLGRAGIGPWWPIVWWALIFTVGLVVLVILIRCGWSKRLSDPAMTLEQMSFTIASGAVAYLLAGEARGVVPSVLAMTLFFGSFGLSRGKMLAIGLYALAIFGLAIAVGVAMGWHPTDVLGLAYAGMVGVVLLGTLAINFRIQDLRERLRAERQALERALAENQALAMHDSLTGLINRRQMLEQLVMHSRRHARDGSGMVIMQLDIDHFKAINDGYGHAAGDRALQDLANILHTNLRVGDFVSRWGGEEFVALLYGVQEDEALHLAERLRLGVQAHRIEHNGRSFSMTVSIGLSAHRTGENVEETLERADRCLYRAKHRGRNSIVCDQLDAASPSLFG